MKTKKLAVLMAFAALAAKAQSNALTLCDQQSGTKHCVTIKAPVSLPADFTCTTSSSGLGSCAGDVSAGFMVTDKTSVNGGSPPSATNGFQVWHDPTSHATDLRSVGGVLNIQGSATGNGNINMTPGNDASNSSVVINQSAGFSGTTLPALLIKNTSGTTSGDIFSILDSSGTRVFGVISSGAGAPNTVATYDIAPIGTTATKANGNVTHRWSTVWGAQADFSLNGTTPPSFSTGETVAHFTGSNSPPSVATRILLDSFQGEPLFTTRRANGTNASPTAVLASEIIGGWSAYGYGATGYGSGGRANLIFGAEENWTDTAQGTFVSLWTNTNGTLSKAERVRINNVGYMGIGTTTPASKLDVNGALTVEPGCHPGFVSGALGIDVCGSVVRIQGGSSMGVAIAPHGGNLIVGTPTDDGTGGMLQVNGFVSSLLGFYSGYISSNAVNIPNGGVLSKQSTVGTLGNYMTFRGSSPQIDATLLGTALNINGYSSIVLNPAVSSPVVINGFLGIGSQAPNAELEVVSSRTVDPRGLVSTEYNSGNFASTLTLRKAGGSLGSPSIVTNGHTISSVLFSAWNGSTWVFPGYMAVSVSVSGSNIGADIRLAVRNNAGGSLTERLSVNGVTGFVDIIGSSSLAVGGTAIVDASRNATFNSGAFGSGGTFVTIQNSSPQISGSSLGNSLNINGSSSGNGNIVLNPGNVTSNSMVYINGRSFGSTTTNALTIDEVGGSLGSGITMRHGGTFDAAWQAGSGAAFDVVSNNATSHRFVILHAGQVLVARTSNDGTGAIFQVNGSLSSNGNLGLTITKNVRDASGTTTCSLVFTGGLLTGGTC